MFEQCRLQDSSVIVPKPLLPASAQLQLPASGRTPFADQPCSPLPLPLFESAFRPIQPGAPRLPWPAAGPQGLKPLFPPPFQPLSSASAAQQNAAAAALADNVKAAASLATYLNNFCDFIALASANASANQSQSQSPSQPPLLSQHLSSLSGSFVGDTTRRCRRCQCPNCLRSQFENMTKLSSPADSKDDANKTGKMKRLHCCHLPGCGKVYGKTSHLRAHLRWHFGERPFVCNWLFCGKSFTR